MAFIAVPLFLSTISAFAVVPEVVFPVLAGTIDGRTYRTTVDVRGASAADCTFELVRPGGAILRSVVHIEPDEPKVFDEFATDFQPLATTVRVSCTGAVDVHSRIHESTDGGITFDDGALYRASAAEPFVAGQTIATPITGDFIVAEVGGAPVRVAATLTATVSGRVLERVYELGPRAQHSVAIVAALRTLGSIDGRFAIEGEGRVIVFRAITDIAVANIAQRGRSRQGIASDPQPPSMTRQLLISSFKAAPFQEPATGLVFMRGRWYDLSTGTFLTPDPQGFADSSNLYAFGKGDPVDTSDPTGRLVRFTGKDPWGDFFLFRGSLHNPAAAALLTLQGDSKHGYVLGLRPGVTKAQFLATAIPDPPTYRSDLAAQGIPLPKDRRTVEEKVFDLISSMHITEFETGDSLTRLSSWPFSWFARTRTFQEATSRYGGAMTLEPSETPSGNTAIAVNPLEINNGSAWAATAAYHLAYDPEIAVIHEFGHALAYHDNNVPCFQMWSVYFENQVRARRGERLFRTSERPLRNDPKTLICP
ncbi:MAG: RHS repeat-associated core domain-containing protein [Acidobacteria bacterium]|nr:RHS repeat-associated core domain-containing protein [Acidobacteriota bacterium]MBV9478488.1 RHS repeat-associated core domain-containing protein [Acidobacteriota bacterium]